MRTTTIITTTTTPWQPTKIRFLNTSRRHNIRPSSLRQQSAACAPDQQTWSSGWTSTSAASSPDQRVSAETGCLHSACNVISYTRQLVLCLQHHQLVLCVHSLLHLRSPTHVSWFSVSIHSFIYDHPHASAGSLSPIISTHISWFSVSIDSFIHHHPHASAGSLCSIISTHVSWFSVSIHSFIYHHPHASAGSLCQIISTHVSWFSVSIHSFIYHHPHASAGSLCPFTYSFTISSVLTAVFHVTLC